VRGRGYVLTHEGWCVSDHTTGGRANTTAATTGTAGIGQLERGGHLVRGSTVSSGQRLTCFCQTRPGTGGQEGCDTVFLGLGGWRGAQGKVMQIQLLPSLVDRRLLLFVPMETLSGDANTET